MMACFLLIPRTMERPGEGPGIDAEDFHRRWRNARLSALHAAEPEMAIPPSQPGESPCDHEERLLESHFSERLLRGIFENSRKLALSLSRHLGVTYELHDFQSLLAGSDIPCFQGGWRAQEKSLVLERPGCAFSAGSGHLACDYWREALDGLVTGLGDRERLARHACVRHGDASCLDVLFADVGGTGNGSTAWGPLPEHMALDLFEASEQFRHRTGITVELKGMNEGVLHYAFQDPTDTRCGSAKSSAELFQELVRERFPGISMKDTTPQAVLGTGSG
jgi:hypothetical protein